MRRFLAHVTIACSLVACESRAETKAAGFEGVVAASLTRAGTAVQHFVFTRKGDRLRIENNTNKLEPIHIVDLEGKKLTIVYPHNTTFVQVDLTRDETKSALPAEPPAGVGPSLPASFFQPAPHSDGAPANKAATPGRIGPNVPPPAGLPSPPPMPPVPVGSPGLTGGAGHAPAIPGMPPGPLPGMPGMSRMFDTGELKKTDQTRKIHGFECVLYTATGRAEKFEIWATSDSALFPFRMIERDYLERRFGPQTPAERWPQLLREKTLFPLEATLKTEVNGQERWAFKIEKIENSDDGGTIDDALFRPPDKYIEVQAPQF